MSSRDGANHVTDAKLTFSQARRILEIIEEKVKTRDRLQAFQASGLLTDLLSVDPEKVDRNEFRKLLGLPVSPWRILVGDPSWGMEIDLMREGHYAKAVQCLSAYGSTTMKDFKAGDFNLVILHPWEEPMSKQVCEEIKRLKPDCKIILMVSAGCNYSDHPYDGQCDLGSGDIDKVIAKL
jgi:hypothetical protein